MKALEEIFVRAKAAVPAVAAMPDDIRAGMLRAVADAVDFESDAVLRANARDLARIPESDPKFDRLRLSRECLAGITSDMRRVAARLAVLAERFRQVNPVWHNAFAEYGVFLEMFPNPDVPDETLSAQWEKTLLARGNALALQSDVRAALEAVAR